MISVHAVATTKERRAVHALSELATPMLQRPSRWNEKLERVDDCDCRQSPREEEDVPPREHNQHPDELSPPLTISILTTALIEQNIPA